MQSVTKRPRPAQLSLFQSTPVTIQWTTLPREVQQQSVRLLARLLHEHCTRHLDSAKGESGDE